MRARLLALVTLTAVAAAGCASLDAAGAPRCEPGQRLGLVAQAVPSAGYVPCVADLPTGWEVSDVDVRDGAASFALSSDRAERDATVELVDRCDVSSAVPIEPRDAAVRTYNDVDAIDPRYRGRIIDVFPGGCVVSSYDFERGAHVTLVAELREAVGLFSRRELRQRLADDLGIRLDR